jgi:hypothetical protein
MLENIKMVKSTDKELLHLLMEQNTLDNLKMVKETDKELTPYANGDTCSGLFENNICWGTVTKDKKIELASMLDTAKTTCKELGFKEQTEKFSECALKLYSQSVELAAKNNQQVVMQGSNSGVMTIYDPVRDNNALMDKGMKMLSGRCTLGIDC